MLQKAQDALLERTTLDVAVAELTDLKTNKFPAVIDRAQLQTQTDFWTSPSGVPGSAAWKKLRDQKSKILAKSPASLTTRHKELLEFFTSSQHAAAMVVKQEAGGRVLSRIEEQTNNCVKVLQNACNQDAVLKAQNTEQR